MKVGAVLGQANCIQGLGDVALARSEHETARAHYAEALPLYEKVGSVQGQGTCIFSLGDIAAQSGDLERSRTYYQAALEFFKRLEEPYSVGLANHRLARIARDKDSRRRHVRSAREAWTQVKREDLLKQLRTEFPGDE